MINLPNILMFLFCRDSKVLEIVAISNDMIKCKLIEIFMGRFFIFLSIEHRDATHNTVA